MSGNALAARNNKDYGQGNGSQSFCTVLRIEGEGEGEGGGALYTGYKSATHWDPHARMSQKEQKIELSIIGYR